MVAAYKGGDARYSQENNNTSVCLAHDKRLYFYSKKISEIEVPIQDYLGIPVTIDAFYYSVFSLNTNTIEKVALKTLVSGIADFVGSAKVFELNTWGQFNLLGRESAVGQVSIASAITDFVSCADSAGLRLTSSLAGRFMAALLAKRFVILSGLAGSGKTKLADAFASWVCSDYAAQIRLIPVGADWSSNENLLGYADALRPDSYCKPASGSLDLLLAACADPNRPYFLILDEMNLSHVERYFADLLSAIESGRELGLHGGTGTLDGIPPKLSLPENLFIIGTVSVDETTYMFSPKVLDRANVIEFRVTADQIDRFLTEPSKIRLEELEAKGAGYGELFVHEARSLAPRLSAIPARISLGVDYSRELNDRLVEAFGALAVVGAEFGFRTAYEISRFVYFHAILVGPGWTFKDALDAQVLQKLLPKLHGSERRLGPVLATLGAFCEKYSLTESKEKIDRMTNRLKDGFTSFAE
jgi:5-methylcytosine-specific restriction protein B